jgi:hypothetical protein
VAVANCACAISWQIEQFADRVQFTKKACESIGINFELRLVGEARKGMDGEGVGIDVEEAVLEVSCHLQLAISAHSHPGKR